MRKLSLLVLLVALASGLMTAGVSAAIFTYSNSPGAAIPDAGPGDCSTSTPNSMTDTITVPDAVSINDLNVSLNITHTWVTDLIVTLRSPAGTTITLVDRVGRVSSGCGFDSNNIITTLDDESGGGPVENANPPTGASYTPQQALSAFDGQNAQGTWTLTVTDASYFDTGTLNSWSLIIDGTAGAATTNAVVNPDPDGDGISGDRDNCPNDFNPDQEDGWGSAMGDACDTEWYNTNGMGVSGFEGKDGLYVVYGNCYVMPDGDVRCLDVGRFDPNDLDPDSSPLDVTTEFAQGWTVMVYYLHSNQGHAVYQVNIYDHNMTLVDDRLEIHVYGDGNWQWFHRGGLSQYNGI